MRTGTYKARIELGGWLRWTATIEYTFDIYEDYSTYGHVFSVPGIFSPTISEERYERNPCYAHRGTFYMSGPWRDGLRKQKNRSGCFFTVEPDPYAFILSDSSFSASFSVTYDDGRIQRFSGQWTRVAELPCGAFVTEKPDHAEQQPSQTRGGGYPPPAALGLPSAVPDAPAVVPAAAPAVEPASGAHVPAAPMSGAGSMQPVLAQSKFKIAYSSARVPRFQHEVFDVLLKFLLAIAAEKGLNEEDAEEFFEGLQEAIMVRSEVDDWLNEVPRLALKLWTSAVIQKGFGREFCSLLNEVVRNDAGEEVFAHAMTLTRLMNTLLVDRRPSQAGSGTPMPPDCQTFRGTGIPWEEVQKFSIGLSYRASMFLATAFKKNRAANFLKKVRAPLVPVLFIFNLDEDFGCDHALYLEGLTLVPGEGEYLYTPYSVFTVVGVEIPASEPSSIKWSKPVIITLAVAPDNSAEPEDLPTMSWH